MKRGLLLANLGTPKSATIKDVKAYLREFLTDKRVIDIPAVFRYLLVYGLVVPFRAKNSSHAYQTIWTEQGSPLLSYSERLVKQVQQKLGDDYQVALAMRYGNPSIEQALTLLGDCDEIIFLPLYPQYSSAASGSSIEEFLNRIHRHEVVPSIKVIRDFYQNPAYLKAQARLIQTYLNGEDNYILFSYHGIPERQIYKTGCKSICPNACPRIADTNSQCYRAQCYETTSLLAQELNLTPDQYSTAFQSRLGKTPWIKPYTDEVLHELAAKGIKHLVVISPSFVTDCLETLEEIGIRAKEEWFALGGQGFTLVPCLNDDNAWVDAIMEIAGTSSQ